VTVNLTATHYIHVAGSAFIFFSLWVLTMLYLVDARRRSPVSERRR
jgi:hypothetical protein